MEKALVLRRVRAAVPLLAAGAFLVAAFLVWRTIERYGAEEIVAALRSLSGRTIALSALFAAASYGTMTLSDWLATRTVTERRVSYPFAALAAFTAIAVGHTVGFGAVSSGTIRYRMYSRRGLSEGDILRIVVFSAATVALGLTALAGATSLMQPALVARFARLPLAVVIALGVVGLLAVAAYLGWAARGRRELSLFRLRLPVPSIATAAAQVAIGTLNYLCVAATLHTLLGDSADVSLLTFAAYYALGHVLAILTHVPAGLGVLELVVLSAAPGAGSVVALVGFRVVYYLAPFFAGALLYAAFEFSQRRRARRRGGRGDGDALRTASASLAAERGRGD